MSLKRGVLTLAVLLPVLLAAVIARYPHIVLKVPKFGFVLYALMGGSVPGYFDGKIFDVEDQWHRKNDVILAVCTKCGTTWAMATMHHIRGHGKQPEYNDIYSEVRWLEFVYYPGQPLQERVDLLTRMHKEYPFSIYKTHLSPPQVKIRNDSLYIIGVRNPIDAVASLRPFLRNHNPEFAKMWGGFPPGAGVPPGKDELETFEHMVLHDIGSGRPMFDVVVMDLIKGWWPYRKLKNVLVSHYTDRIKDHKGEIARMAKFTGVDLTDDELNAVAEQTSFKMMKKHEWKYNPSHVLEEFRRDGRVPKSVGSLTENIVNVGSRKGEEELRPSLVEAIRKRLENDCGPEITKWLLEGGHNIPDIEMPK